MFGRHREPVGYMASPVFTVPRDVAFHQQQFFPQPPQQFPVRNVAVPQMGPADGICAEKCMRYFSTLNQPHDHRSSNWMKAGLACCAPTGCVRHTSDPIDPAEPGDAVRMVCSNRTCVVGRWMHADCFDDWNRKVASIARCCEQDGGCRFSQQMEQVLALLRQLRTCICGNGLLIKDPNYFAEFADSKNQVHMTSSTGDRGLRHQLQQLLLQQDQQQQQRLRSCSFSSTGSGSCSSGSSSSVGSGSSSCGYSSTSASPPLSPPRSFFPSSTTVPASTPPPQMVAVTSATTSSPVMRAVVGHRSSPTVSDDAGVGMTVGNVAAGSSSGFRQFMQMQQPGQLAAVACSIPSNVMPISQSVFGQCVQKPRRFPNAASEVVTPDASVGCPPDAEISSTSNKPQPNARGNIFRHRSDLSVYRAIRPSARNAFCIQLDDDGPHGNNDTRKFLMHKLTARGVSVFQCVACRRTMPVYDEFPVVDGALFLSPRSYDVTDSGMANGSGLSSSSSPYLSVQVVYNRRMLSLHAVCLDCLGQTVVADSVSATGTACGSAGPKSKIRCRSCRAPWSLGSVLIVGTMYSYDVFACAPCCADRRRCRRCGKQPSGSDDPKSFSDFSKLSACVHCGLEDYHYVRPFQDVFFVSNEGAAVDGSDAASEESNLVRRRL